jgi:hypothetical protein
MIGREQSGSDCETERVSWHNRGMIGDPQFSGSRRRGEKSVMFVRNLKCIESAGVPRWSVSAQ